jgi:hypothetical protein
MWNHIRYLAEAKIKIADFRHIPTTDLYYLRCRSKDDLIDTSTVQ